MNPFTFHNSITKMEMLFNNKLLESQHPWPVFHISQLVCFFPVNILQTAVIELSKEECQCKKGLF